MNRWKQGVVKRAVGCILAALVLAVGMSPPVRQLDALPDSLYITQGGTAWLDLRMPLDAEIEGESARVLSSMDQSLEDDGRTGITLQGGNVGKARLVLRLMGVPVKTVNVNVQPERVVVPGGHSIGVAIDVRGVLVVGASDIGNQPSPARLCGLKAGDTILAVDGMPIESAAQLSACIAEGGAYKLSVARNGETLDMDVTPVCDDRDGCYRLGVWVRDSTAGVGTLSFYDLKSGMYGALGHAITDVDTGSILAVDEGAIYTNRVVEVLKGTAGKPGELLGEFMETGEEIGSVTDNGNFGIYGRTDAVLENPLYPQGVPVLARSEIQKGAAQLLTTLEDGQLAAYDCEIVKLFHQEEPTQRSMIVRVTDSRLLENTGGIVQGMSGSPILQDGQLAGVVTHVYIDDPQQGYAIYAEWMLSQCE